MNSNRTADRADAVPESVIALYLHARSRILQNQPFCAADKGGDLILAETEQAALARVGLSVSPARYIAPDQQDPSIAGYMALLGTSLTTTEAAKLLDVDPSSVRRRLRERSLYGLEYEGKKHLPRFQFHKRKALPGLRSVLAALPENLNPLDIARWFLSANSDLEMDAGDSPLSPRHWLIRGQPIGLVVQLAGQIE